MAFSIESLRSLIVDSIKGRKLGLDFQGYLTGALDVRNPIEDISSTALTTASQGGITNVITSGSSQTSLVNLPVPLPGVQKILYQTSTSTGTAQFGSTANGASILSGSDGTTKSVVTLLGKGASVTLEALSTLIWAVVGQSGSSASPLVSYTTST